MSAATAWHARLDLRLREQGERTVLAERRHEGPLLVQRAFHPEGPVCHLYLIHPPGGIVGGDQLRLQVECEPGSHALITTPAATRFYRSGPHPRARLMQQLRVDDACLEWLPQETIVFDGANATVSTEVFLTGDARFIGWETCCLGRPASGEDFARGDLRLDLLLWREGVPLLSDRLRLRGGSPALTAGWGLSGRRAIGTFVALPGSVEVLRTMRAIDTQGVSSACSLVDGLMICRALADGSEALRRHFQSLWTAVRPVLLRRFATPPRIWAT